MRTITKDITLNMDGTPVAFRLTKPDAFSGVSLVRLVLRAQEGKPEATVLDLLSGLSEAELKSVLAACLEHTAVLLPAGPNPVMTAGEWTWPELRHDLPACLTLAAEEIAWTLEGFFGDGGRTSRPAGPITSP